MDQFTENKLNGEKSEREWTVATKVPSSVLRAEVAGRDTLNTVSYQMMESRYRLLGVNAVQQSIEPIFHKLIGHCRVNIENAIVQFAKNP
jgi:hypothetical protein